MDAPTPQKHDMVYMDTVHFGGFFYAGMAPLKNDSPRLSIAE